MKYSKTNPPLVCMQTQSTCYKGTWKMTVRGVLWHSTAANNPYISRYVQPSDDAKDRAEMLKILGRNKNGNDWNHIHRSAGLNCWVGKLADGTVSTVQTMPWNYAPWGCASGKRGSCNNGWVQFEIAEDSLTDRNYFNAVYQEAVEITAYICDLYGLDPLGTVSYAGIKVPVILCHQDSYQLGLGSNHGDVYHWFNRYGKDMNDVRKDVAACMKTKGVEDLTKAETNALIEERIKQIQIPDAAAIARAIIAEQTAQRQAAPVADYAAGAVSIAKTIGLTDGSRPQDYLTRQDGMLLAIRMLGLDEDTPGQWSEDARTWAVENGLVKGTGIDDNGNTSYDWTSPMTREQMVTLLYRLEQYNKGDF